MIDKDLLNYLGDKKKYIIFIVLSNIVNLFFNLGVTGSLVVSTYYFINSNYIYGVYCVLFTLLFGLLKLITTHISSSLSNKLADFVTYKLREETYTKYLKLEGKTPFTTSEMAQLSTEGIEQLRLYYSNYLPSFFYAMIAPLILFVLFMFMDIPVAFTYLACVPLIPVSIMLVSRWAKRIFAKYWDQYISLGNSFLDNTKGMKELKIFKYDDVKQKQMEDESEGFRKITMKVLVMQLASVTIMDLVAFGGAGIGIVLSLHANLNPYLTTFMILIGAEFFLPLRSLGSAFHIAMNGATAGKKIMTLLKLDETKCGNNELEAVNKVSMENVSFGYEDSNEDVLKNINLSFSKGLYSLVGVSGSGKSTIAKLFSKTLKQSSGEIKINDEPLTSYNSQSFYSKICYISSNTYIFHRSIRDSFLFYNEYMSEAQMKELLHRVKLDHLPLDLIIEEDSTNLSGGEKQRLTLALYLSKQFDFYIFDEITSNIDIESEEIILNIIKEISKTKVVLMISHRLKSTSYSNHIYYLEKGNIVCDGTYEELLKSDNEFKRLYDTQVALEEIL